MKPIINTQILDRINMQYSERFGTPPMAVVRAPGRINLLGEHVDYNDGFVMPAAIERATYIAFGEATGKATDILAADFNQEIGFDEASLPEKKQSDNDPLPDWGMYPAGVASVLLQNDYPLQPIQAVFASDIPMGSGLSSSASVEVGFITAWAHVAKLSIRQMEKAQLCLQAEKEYVGVKCGIMDQFASACGIEGHLLQLDCRSLDWDSIPFPEEVSIVIADTKVRRKLVSGEYNLRRQDCEEAVRLLQTQLPAIRSLRDVSMEDFNRHFAILPERVGKRARHVVEEIARTMVAKEYLAQGKISDFGRLMNLCHQSLRDLYEVSGLELDAMASIAQSLDGCLGSRLTGAGFGGCTVSLVETGMVEGFCHDLAERYTQKIGQTPDIYVTRASNGAEVL